MTDDLNGLRGQWRKENREDEPGIDGWWAVSGAYTSGSVVTWSCFDVRRNGKCRVLACDFAQLPVAFVGYGLG
jgi:hypothetical protein